MEKNTGAATSEESTIVIGKYKIDLRAMCPKKKSISDYISLTQLAHTNKNSEIDENMNAPKGLNCHTKRLHLHQIRLNDLVFI